MFQTTIIHTQLEELISRLSELSVLDTSIKIVCKQNIANETVDPRVNDITVFYKLILVNSEDTDLLVSNENYTLKVLLVFPTRFFNVDESSFLKELIFENIKNIYDNKSFTLSKEKQEEYRDTFPNLINNPYLDCNLNNTIETDIGNCFIDAYSETAGIISYDGNITLEVRIFK